MESGALLVLLSYSLSEEAIRGERCVISGLVKDGDKSIRVVYLYTSCLTFE